VKDGIRMILRSKLGMMGWCAGEVDEISLKLRFQQ
jgi:hypothetical protein